MNIMIWEKDGTSFEIRTQGQLPDGRPALDEIVAEGAFVHLEQMCHDHWWMGIRSGGKYFHLNFGVKDGRLCWNSAISVWQIAVTQLKDASARAMLQLDLHEVQSATFLP